MKIINVVKNLQDKFKLQAKIVNVVKTYKISLNHELKS